MNDDMLISVVWCELFLAFRIHVSPQTKIILDELTGYVLQHRGKVLLKGKGEVDSFWLTGKKDFNKQLPTPLDTDP